MTFESMITVPKFMTPNKAAVATGIPVYIIRKKLRNGELRYFREGKTYFVDMTSLMEIIQGRNMG